jgi:hypothetical protein
MYCSVQNWMSTDVSEMRAASIIITDHTENVTVCMSLRSSARMTRGALREVPHSVAREQRSGASMSTRMHLFRENHVRNNAVPSQTVRTLTLATGPTPRNQTSRTAAGPAGNKQEYHHHFWKWHCASWLWDHGVNTMVIWDAEFECENNPVVYV